MAVKTSKAAFQSRVPNARNYAKLDAATQTQHQITPKTLSVKKDQFAGKKIVVLGAGVGGLTTAYELLKHECGAEVVVIEAANRTGGRCLTLRTGDTLQEDKNRELFNAEPGEKQVVRFKRPSGDSEPYLNAGPGRIPSSHTFLLNYLKEFGVDVEVYIMNSESNLVQKDSAFLGKPMAYRQLDHNTRGWLAEMVFNHSKSLIESVMSKKYCNICREDLDQRSNELRSLMVDFGELSTTPNPGVDPESDDLNGFTAEYIQDQGEDGLENGKTRAGYKVLPAVEAGKTEEALSFNELLDAKFWEGTRFFQSRDFLWQQTLFQPVGGMDRVQHAFAQQVAALGGDIMLNSPVSKIDWNGTQFVIEVQQIGKTDPLVIHADYCFSNIAMPFLQELLSENLYNAKLSEGFSPSFTSGLHAVFKAQEGVKEEEDADFITKFLACTTKVGWQADRNLWQNTESSAQQTTGSEAGVMPIFGGISWTNAEIQQIWYPSTGYHDEKGVLTGAYNFSDIAFRWGELPVSERLVLAKEDAKKFGTKFGEGLQEGIAIAWQNMPYIKGGWAQWHVVNEAAGKPASDQYAADMFSELSQGTGVFTDGVLSQPNFFVVGDQLSSLPGWQEGAIASALVAVERAANPSKPAMKLTALPDTRLMVEGV